jgi:hypothetical protein
MRYIIILVYHLTAHKQQWNLIPSLRIQHVGGFANQFITPNPQNFNNRKSNYGVVLRFRILGGHKSQSSSKLKKLVLEHKHV